MSKTTPAVDLLVVGAGGVVLHTQFVIHFLLEIPISIRNGVWAAGVVCEIHDWWGVDDPPGSTTILVGLSSCCWGCSTPAAILISY